MARAVSVFAEQHCKGRHILCLPPATGELPETGGVIVASPAQPIRKPIEHAGHIYQEKVIRAYCINYTYADDNASTTSHTSDSSSQSTPANRRPSADTASVLASKLAVGSDDLYELLELGDKRWHATSDDIKKKFRQISLIYHPDKISHIGEQARENSEAHFKAVMKAYDILSDKKKRAAYDSIDDVDDSIPSERDATVSPERFYEKFGECFALNARWSVSNRVPELGDDKTDLETVNKFYDFWYSFKSWRDFSFDLEYDLDQAECREEKRWMERQNAKRVKSKKLEENMRIRKLVDLAYKHDPRLQRERETAKAKKNAQKQAKKQQAEQRAKAERERQEREKADADRKETEEKTKRAAAKKKKENARQVVRKARQKLRALSRELDLVASEHGSFIVEKMCMDGTADSIEAVCSRLSELELDQQGATEKGIDILERAVENPREMLLSDNVADGARENSHEFSNAGEDISYNLKKNDKASKSEGRDANRVSDSPKSKSHDRRRTAGESHWTADELSLLSKGVAKFPGGTVDRWTKLADLIGSKSPDEVLQKVNESRAAKAKANNLSANSSSKTDNAKASDRFQEKQGKPIASESKGKILNGNSSVSGSPSQPPNKLHFTPKEQNLFEGALKKYPTTQGEARWKKVSSVVGRSPDECQQRFKELIAFFQAKKQGQ